MRGLAQQVVGSSDTSKKSMSIVESLDESIHRRRHECSQAVAKNFHSSVRAIFASTESGSPVFVGTCVLLSIQNAHYVVTAAHIIDWTSTHAIYLGGTVGTEPVQIVGDINARKSPKGQRTRDRFDFAFWKVPQASVEKLGDVTFLGSDRVSRNQAPVANRFYLAIGYPLARNKGNIADLTQSIKTSLSKYTGKSVTIRRWRRSSRSRATSISFLDSRNTRKLRMGGRSIRSSRKE